MTKTNRRPGILVVLAIAALTLLAFAMAPAQAASENRPDHARSDERPENARGERPDHAGSNGAQSRDNDGDHDDDPDTLHTDVEHNEADDGDNLHPSGKDRQADNHNLEHNPNQGKSESDPDGTTNGGADKPDGEGGLDQEDQDGNNGCGNDDDFEDDNRGLCLGPEGAPGQQVDEDDVQNEVDVEDEVLTQVDTAVLGVTLEREQPAAASDAGAETMVLSAADSRATVAAERDALAFGGVPAAGLAVLGLGMTGAGTVLVRRRQR